MPTGYYKIRITSVPVTASSISDESDLPFSIAAAPTSLLDIENMLASISQAISQLAEKVKELIGR